MTTDAKQGWLQAGYQLFASDGPQGLKVELLARRVKKSKSSFYHHFSDVSIFVDELLDLHLTRGQAIIMAAQACQRMNPDFLLVMLDHQEDLFFQRQLRIHRQDPRFAACMKKTHEPVEEAFLQIWANSLKLDNELFLAQAFLRLVVDNFYMRITPQNMHLEWLSDYLQELANMIQGIEVRKKI